MGIFQIYVIEFIECVFQQYLTELLDIVSSREHDPIGISSKHPVITEVLTSR